MDAAGLGALLHRADEVAELHRRGAAGSWRPGALSSVAAPITTRRRRERAAAWSSTRQSLIGVVPFERTSPGAASSAVR